MSDNPWVLLAALAVVGYVARLWWLDLAQARRGSPNPHALPGATPASALAIALAAGGAAILVGIETAGEYALGIVEQQTRITVLFGLYTLAAAFVEELIFRGFVIIDGRGRGTLIASAVLASLLFAVMHPYLWELRDGDLHWHTSGKAWFSTAMLFSGSLWFYFVRYWRLNPTWSLLPCIAAHFTKNLAVFGVKYAQGFVGGFW